MVKSNGRGQISGAGPGRPKGAKNKFTNLKESFLSTYQEIGGDKEFAKWAKNNRGTFYQMITKLLPKTVDGDFNFAVGLGERMKEAEERLKEYNKM
jgi:hypothetical protein